MASTVERYAPVREAVIRSGTGEQERFSFSTDDLQYGWYEGRWYDRWMSIG